jgi:hypothetical protein
VRIEVGSGVGDNTSKRGEMSKKANNPVDPVQQALDSLVAMNACLGEADGTQLGGFRQMRFASS